MGWPGSKADVKSINSVLVSDRPWQETGSLKLGNWEAVLKRTLSKDLGGCRKSQGIVRCPGLVTVIPVTTWKPIWGGPLAGTGAGAAAASL